MRTNDVFQVIELEPLDPLEGGWDLFPRFECENGTVIGFAESDLSGFGLSRFIIGDSEIGKVDIYGGGTKDLELAPPNPSSDGPEEFATAGSNFMLAVVVYNIRPSGAGFIRRMGVIVNGSLLYLLRDEKYQYFRPLDFHNDSPVFVLGTPPSIHNEMGDEDLSLLVFGESVFTADDLNRAYTGKLLAIGETAFGAALTRAGLKLKIDDEGITISLSEVGLEKYSDFPGADVRILPQSKDLIVSDRSKDSAS